ncbi:portal protein, partial [Thalassospira lucentensis]
MARKTKRTYRKPGMNAGGDMSASTGVSGHGRGQGRTNTGMTISPHRSTPQNDLSVSVLRQRYQAAVDKRRTWLAHWQDCYEFALPQRNGAALQTSGGKRLDRVFDATAPDAVEQLAASLMAEITPPAGGWFDLEPGGNVAGEDRAVLTEQLGRAVRILQG